MRIPKLVWKVGLAAALAGGALGLAPAAAQASSVYVTTDPEFGGQFYCGGAYDGGTYNCEDVVTFGSTVQVFVIGTDHAVWTIWNGGGGWSNWVSLGGKGYSYVWFTNYNGAAFTINVIGGDGGTWHRDRHSNGSWSGWYE